MASADDEVIMMMQVLRSVFESVTFYNSGPCMQCLQDFAIGLAEIGQNGQKSQQRSRTVVFLCKIEF